MREVRLNSEHQEAAAAAALIVRRLAGMCDSSKLVLLADDLDEIGRAYYEAGPSLEERVYWGQHKQAAVIDMWSRKA